MSAGFCSLYLVINIRVSEQRDFQRKYSLLANYYVYYDRHIMATSSLIFQLATLHTATPAAGILPASPIISSAPSPTSGAPTASVP